MNTQKKILVTYFSCSGVTKRVAETLVQATGADIFEIKPAEAYTSADLNWTDKKSRSSLEMKDSSSRPETVGIVDNMAAYEVVFVGFPIWWYTAPTIIRTFLEKYDFSNKTLIPFATSGSSGIGTVAQDLANSVTPNAKWSPGRRFNGSVGKEELKSWVESLQL